MIHTLNFYTSHHQFYIRDKESPGKTEEEAFWTAEAAHSRLAIGDGVLGIGLECYGSFKGELILLNSQEDLIQYDGYDHIVEAGLFVKSGILQVLNCPGSNIELEIKISPGKYRVRIYSLNLASVMDDSGDDHYRIEIWPGIDTERNILKQYAGIGEGFKD